MQVKINIVSIVFTTVATIIIRRAMFSTADTITVLIHRTLAGEVTFTGMTVGVLEVMVMVAVVIVMALPLRQGFGCLFQEFRQLCKLRLRQSGKGIFRSPVVQGMGDFPKIVHQFIHG